MTQLNLFSVEYTKKMSIREAIDVYKNMLRNMEVKPYIGQKSILPIINLTENEIRAIEKNEK